MGRCALPSRRARVDVVDDVRALVAHSRVVADGAYHRVSTAQGNGRVYAIRTCHRSQWDRTPDQQLAFEFDVQRAIERTRIAPAPYGFVPGTPPMVVEEFVDGRVFDRATDGPRLAATLARLHRIPVTPALTKLLPSQASVDRLEFDARLSRVPPGAVRCHLEAAVARFPAPDDGRPGLVHGDLVAGNLLVDDSGSCRILDWEGARLADPAWDLAYHLSPVTAWWSEPRAERPSLEALPDGSDALLAAYAGSSTVTEASLRRRIAAWMPRVVLRTIVWAADLQASGIPLDDRASAVAALSDLALARCLTDLQELITA